jgi:hypothetical protein
MTSEKRLLGRGGYLLPTEMKWQEAGESCTLKTCYSLADTVTMIKPRRMVWAGYVACMGQKTNAYRILIGNLEGMKPLGNYEHR